MLRLRRQKRTNASWTTSSASAALRTHCRAKSRSPGASSEKQTFQSSWAATFSMTFYGLLELRRRQLLILSRPRQVFGLLVTGGAVTFAAAQTPDPSAAREIARLDSQYSKLSVEKGMPAASVDYFADDGIA